MFSQVRCHVGVHISEAVERAQCQVKGKPADQSHYPVHFVRRKEARHFGCVIRRHWGFSWLRFF